MAFSFNCFLFIVSFVFFFLSSSAATTTSNPKSLLLKVSKDRYTNQYIIQINQKTPTVPVKLVLDLSLGFTWINCEEGYVSSSYRPTKCKSRVCPVTGSIGTCSSGCGPNPKPGCYNNTCTDSYQNSITGVYASEGEIGEDIAFLTSFDAKNPTGRNVSLPRFLFVCGTTSLLDNLADGVTGVAALGRLYKSLPYYYFSNALGLSKSFALCLSPSTKNNGLLSFGDGLVPINDLLTYTPIRKLEYSYDYHISVKSIRVDGKEIRFNKTLLTYDENESRGGTILSTAKPYSILETSIYKALVKAFVKKMTAATIFSPIPSPVVSPVPVPFPTCFDTVSYDNEEAFLSMLPVIDLELESEEGRKIYWTIPTANAMIKVSTFTTCLAFLDGGSSAYLKPSIIIGGRQLEDTFLHFDLDNSRLGFSSHLPAKNTSCSSFINSSSP